MRVVLHAGLHKSGTTTLQNEWQAAFSDKGPTWYPSPPGKLPGHHACFWPLLAAFREERPADLVWAHQRRRGDVSLDALVEEAAASGVQTLVLSTEELDRIQPEDVPGLRACLEPHHVTSLITVTPPLHRWCSGWQELVKHGLSQYPRPAAEHVMSYVALSEGRLEQIASLLPGEKCYLRVLRTRPPEPQLARDVAEAVGIAWPRRRRPLPARNTSLGTDAAIVRRMNEADLALGTRDQEAKALLERIRDSGVEWVEDPALAELFEPPESFWRAARAEQRFLRDCDGSSGIEVVDPYDVVGQWLEQEPSTWYAEISRSRPVFPQLDTVVDEQELLWRVRQERSALRANLANVDRRLQKLQQRVRRLSEELAAARGRPVQRPDGAAGGDAPAAPRLVARAADAVRSAARRKPR